jgi:hypothetical protein
MLDPTFHSLINTSLNDGGDGKYQMAGVKALLKSLLYPGKTLY